MNNYQQTADSALKLFRATAVIDWLDVEIHTECPTQHQHIRRALREITSVNRWWVEAIDKQPGDVTDTFRIRFHDELANNYQQLHAALYALARRFAFTAEPTITGIEISCDFWHKQQSVEATRALTYRMQTSLFAPSTNHRQYNDNKSSNQFLDKPGKRINPAYNLRVGNKDDAISWQCYHKRTDKKQPLPLRQQRARIEVTLQGDALQQHGFGLLSELQHFPFETLASLFTFRRPIAAAQMAKGDLFRLISINWIRSYRDATTERGVHSFSTVGQRDKKGRTRTESSHLTADKELSNRVRAALRNLQP
ncbi:hypothetical protein NKT44_003861 [Escherichia coli]|uniref:hypothetical protein n=1 Tax=Enterobacteriaceae TaxID=543 RepID=UPI00062C9943|nr:MULTISPECIES: hypothetical protein [Enterobacteriaceae]EFS2243639.1 hypothetical protein [Shigella sonnei]AKH24915.1 hypothetical protein AA102_13755 [Escherichia coli]EAC0483228.1 hypothetical protein [Escherichia coli]EEW2210715.1 hypothetical protein [Escherichia coli]EEW8936754.1 hypothetical protein [Escherichia coli]